MMKNPKHFVMAILTVVMIPVLMGGCRLGSVRPESRGELRFNQPRSVVGFYLKSLFKRNMWKEAYECLTPQFREEVAFEKFVELIKQQIPESLLDPTMADVRTNVKIMHTVNLAPKRTIVCALLTVYYPYETGEKDTYRVARFSCHLTRKGWRIKPVEDKSRDMIFLVPVHFYGPLWKYGKESEAILEAMRKEEIEGSATLELLPEQPKPQEEIASVEPPFEETAHPPDSEKVEEPLAKSIIEAVPAEESGEPSEVAGILAEQIEAIEKAAEHEETTETVSDTESVMAVELEAAIQQQVESLVRVGKLHLETGEVKTAQKTFLKALEIDHDDETVLTYLEYCRKYYELKNDKKQELDLIKSIIEIIGEEEPRTFTEE